MQGERVWDINCMIYYGFDMQIADFGLSRDVSEDDIYVSQGGMIPIRWTAPEVIMYL